MVRKGFIAFMVILLSGCSGKVPEKRGVHQGNLLPCSSKPNCVSTAPGDTKHFISPIEYTSSREQAIDEVENFLQKQEKFRIKENDAGYFWVECSSSLFGFVDDLEIYFPADTKRVFIRSASRLGYSDLGVNRKRVEQIRTVFTD